MVARYFASARGEEARAEFPERNVCGEERPFLKRSKADLRIKQLTITPVALPDPLILAASGCQGPYFLRNVVEIENDDGVVGIGETHGGETVTEQLTRCRKIILGKSAFAYRGFVGPMSH